MKKFLSLVALIAFTITGTINVSAAGGLITPYSTDPGGGGGGGYLPGTIFISSDAEAAKYGFNTGYNVGHAAIAISSTLVAESHPYWNGVDSLTISTFLTRYSNVGYGLPDATVSQMSSAAGKADNYLGNDNGWAATPNANNNPATSETNCSGYVWYSYKFGASVNIIPGETGNEYVTPRQIYNNLDLFTTIKGSINFGF